MTPPFTIQGPDDEGNVPPDEDKRWLEDMFWLEGPDEFGDVSLCNLNGDGMERHLGKSDQVVEILSQWLGEQDYQERTL